MHRESAWQCTCGSQLKCLAGRPLQLAADPAGKGERDLALELYGDIARAYARNPGRWAFTNGVPNAVGRVTVAYSLKQLSRWLSRGGMALGAPAPCACTII